MSNNNAGNGGLFTTLLQILFIALKLTGVIGWSWVWVLAPTWISFLFAVCIIVFIILIRAWVGK